MKKEIESDILLSIYKGLDLTYKKLLISKQKEDGELVIMQDGRIVKVKAKDLLVNS